MKESKMIFYILKMVTMKKVSMTIILAQSNNTMETTTSGFINHMARLRLRSRTKNFTLDWVYIEMKILTSFRLLVNWNQMKMKALNM